MGSSRRRSAAILILGAFGVACAALVAHGSGPSSVGAKASEAAGVFAHVNARERERGEQDGGADAEAYSDRAYPGTDITIDQIESAISANVKIETRSSGKVAKKWDFLGPQTLNVDRLGTQAFNKATQWSGRVTAMAVAPKCKSQSCTLYVAAAGGGVWRSKNALAENPSWKSITEDIPTNAIGSIAVDPNDSTGKTIYVGTGEANNSGDSEAGLGLFKTTDEGSSWSLVPGTQAITNNRAIAWIAIDPRDANHILLATRQGTRGIGSNATSGAPPGAPAIGVYETHDGAAWTLVKAGSVNEVKFDPTNPNVVYATVAGAVGNPQGLFRSVSGGPWEAIFSGTRTRYSFSPVVLPNGKTRIYLADASGSGQGAQVYRVDDASQPAATLTASNNAAWTVLSNPTDGTPGFAVFNYCNTPLVGSQCVYDMFILSPADRPDMVVVGGLMHYEELRPYAAPGGVRSNGRSVLMSMDAGATWTDLTGDVGGESMHPDQHAIAFVPGAPDKMFVGSDGGVIRTSGQWADASSQCDSRGLTSALFLADCKAWLKQIPTELSVVNAGLGTLQMTSIAVSPFDPEGSALAGTQDNGTLAFSGEKTWILPLTGDGGDAGFDAFDPNLHFHTYTGGQMDVNYNGNDPKTWLWVGDRFIINFPESIRFYAPAISDPIQPKTIYVGAQRVWRTQNAGGDRAFLEAHCNTAANEFGTSDLLFTGACGTPADWSPLGASTLTGTAFGTTKSGSNLTSLSRGRDAVTSTLWAGTGGGRVLVSRNANAPATNVTFTRVDTAAQPTRVVSSVFADPTNPNHAIVTFSGFDVTTPTTPGHVFDVVFDPVAGTATWTNISYDVGDQPVNDAVLDVASGDIYVSTDFGVLRLVNGTQTWITAAEALPTAAVSGLTLAAGKGKRDRLLYAATHGRGAYRLRLK